MVSKDLSEVCTIVCEELSITDVNWSSIDRRTTEAKMFVVRVNDKLLGYTNEALSKELQVVPSRISQLRNDQANILETGINQAILRRIVRRLEGHTEMRNKIRQALCESGANLTVKQIQLIEDKLVTIL